MQIITEMSAIVSRLPRSAIIVIVVVAIAVAVAAAIAVAVVAIAVPVTVPVAVAGRVAVGEWYRVALGWRRDAHLSSSQDPRVIVSIVALQKHPRQNVNARNERDEARRGGKKEKRGRKRKRKGRERKKRKERERKGKGEKKNKRKRERKRSKEKWDKHTPFIGTLYSQSSFPMFLVPCDEAGGVKVAGGATVAIVPWWRW